MKNKEGIKQQNLEDMNNMLEKLRKRENVYKELKMQEGKTKGKKKATKTKEKKQKKEMGKKKLKK